MSDDTDVVSSQAFQTLWQYTGIHVPARSIIQGFRDCYVRNLRRFLPALLLSLDVPAISSLPTAAKNFMKLTQIA